MSICRNFSACICITTSTCKCCITTFCTCGSCYCFIISVSLCRNCFLSKYYCTTYWTVLTFCKTCAFASRCYRCINYFSMSVCRNFFLFNLMVASWTMWTLCQTCVQTIRSYCIVNDYIVTKCCYRLCSKNISTITNCTFKGFKTSWFTSRLCCDSTSIFNMYMFNFNTNSFVRKGYSNFTVWLSNSKCIVAICIRIISSVTTIWCSPSMIQCALNLVWTRRNIFVHFDKTIIGHSHIVICIGCIPFSAQISTCTNYRNRRSIFTPSSCTTIPHTRSNSKKIITIGRNC